MHAGIDSDLQTRQMGDELGHQGQVIEGFVGNDERAFEA